MSPDAANSIAIVTGLEWFFVIYFLLLHGGHALLTAVSMNNLRRRMESIAAALRYPSSALWYISWR